MGAVSELLSNDLAASMRAEAKAIQQDSGRVKGADLLERLALTREPVTG